MSSPNDTFTTPSGEKNITFPDGMTAVSPYSKNAPTPDIRNGTPSSGISTASSKTIATVHGSTAAVTTVPTTKRKQTFSDPQEESQESPKKKARTPTAFEFIRNTFGHTLNDLRLLKEALDTTGTYRPQSNQSLALIGNSILQTTIYREWYPSKQLKGTGNMLVQTIACNANLAKVASKIGLGAYIVTQQNIVPPQSLLATTMEAVLGAIDCDSGEDANAVRKAMKMAGLVPGATS